MKKNNLLQNDILAVPITIFIVAYIHPPYPLLREGGYILVWIPLVSASALEFV